ncbi:type VII secretion system-associated protein [Streptantibioticus parmotrematis]|uniref:type VII secretion system-associated protein n=1 Tax=Streptantibioticus parmotrematis TaxID=2873249 RepID=UPI0034042B4F
MSGTPDEGMALPERDQQPDSVRESAAGTRTREPSAEGGRGSLAGAESPQDPGATVPEDLPPVPDHILEAARQAPDHWFGMVDPTWAGEDAPPEWAVVGQWRSDADGRIVEWRDNEAYRPSPRALEWDEPTDPVDAAVQLAATGYGPAEAVTRALADAEVAVFVNPGGGPLCAVAPDDVTPVVPVFTSPDHLHAAGRLSFTTLKVAELLDRLPEGHLLYLNPSASVSMAVEPAALREPQDVDATADADGQAEPDGVAEPDAAADADGAVDAESAWSGDLDDILPLQPGASDAAGVVPHPRDGERP